MCLNLGYELHCRTPSTVLTVVVLCLHLIMPRIYCRATQRRLAVKVRQKVCREVEMEVVLSTCVNI